MTSLSKLLRCSTDSSTHATSSRTEDWLRWCVFQGGRGERGGKIGNERRKMGHGMRGGGGREREEEK